MVNHKKPEWVNREYGGYGSSWWEVVYQARAALMEWAREGQPKTYTELAERVDAVPWPEGAHTHEGSQIGWLLGQVSTTEWLEGRPLISAFVVGADTREPSHGFYELAVQLGELKAGVGPDQMIAVGPLGVDVLTLGMNSDSYSTPTLPAGPRARATSCVDRRNAPLTTLVVFFVP